MNLVKGGKYNWINQRERLVYLGHNWAGDGYWHQFALVESPSVVWCEVSSSQLSQFEETIDEEKLPTASGAVPTTVDSR